MRRRATTIMARCHPARRAVDGEHCKHCLPRTLGLETVMAEAPPACTHCRERSGWHGDDLVRHCMYCGTWWERPLAVVG